MYGLVYLDATKCLYIDKFKSFLSLTSMIVFNISQYLYVYFNLKNPMLLIARGGTVVLYSSLVSKALVSVIYRQKFNVIFEDIDNTMKCIDNYGNQALKNILDKYVNINGKLTKIVSSMTTVSLVLFYAYLILVFFILYR